MKIPINLNHDIFPSNYLFFQQEKRKRNKSTRNKAPILNFSPGRKETFELSRLDASHHADIVVSASQSLEGRK